MQFQLFDELPVDEYGALKADIAKRGVLVPIEFDDQGNILDGHHRKRAVDELGIKDYPTVTRHFASDDEKEEHVITLNVRRRHLNGEQKRRWTEWFLRRHPEWTDRRVASEVGLSHPTVARVREEMESDGSVEKFTTRVGKDGVAQKAEKAKPVAAPSIFAPAQQVSRAQSALASLGDAAPAKQLDVKRAERMARDADTDARRAEAAATVTELHGEITIVQSSAVDLEVDADSVDLIFTDPPYPEEFLPAWSELAELAVHALKPGGLVVAYTGQMFLPEVISRMSEHLDYWWSFAIRHTGSFFQLKARHVQVGWKPLLVYRKPGKELPPWTIDFTDKGSREKSGHDWQQAEGEAAYWIDQLTKPGDHVVDPFVGSGTTAAACKTLGRRFTGCDVDPLAVKTAQERVA